MNRLSCSVSALLVLTAAALAAQENLDATTRATVGQEWWYAARGVLDADGGRRFVTEQHLVDRVLAVDAEGGIVRVFRTLVCDQEIDAQARVQPSPYQGTRFLLARQDATTDARLWSGAADLLRGVPDRPTLPLPLDALLEGQRFSPTAPHADLSHFALRRIIRLPEDTPLSGAFRVTARAFGEEEVQFRLEAQVSIAGGAGALKGGGTARYHRGLRRAVEAELSGQIVNPGDAVARGRAQYTFRVTEVPRSYLSHSEQVRFNWWDEIPIFRLLLPSGADPKWRTTVLGKPTEAPDRVLNGDPSAGSGPAAGRQEELYQRGLVFQTRGKEVVGVSVLGRTEYPNQVAYGSLLPFHVQFGQRREEVRNRLGSTRYEILTPRGSLLGYRVPREGREFTFDFWFDEDRLVRIDVGRLD